MSESSFDVRVTTSCAPTGARLLPTSLDDFAAARLGAREEVLRDEGRQVATAGAVQLFEEAIASLEEHRGNLLISLADTAATLAVEIAQVLVSKELSEGNYDIAAIVRETLASGVGTSGETTIHVNPDDAKELEEIRFRSGTSVQADPAIRRGSVQVETDQGLLVRDIDERLAAIRETLREALSPC